MRSARPVQPPLVHQEADRAAVHPEHRQVRALALEHSVQRVEHEAVAAQRDEVCARSSLGERIALAEQAFAALRAVCRCDESRPMPRLVRSLGFIVAGRSVCAQASMSLAASIRLKT